MHLARLSALERLRAHLLAAAILMAASPSDATDYPYTFVSIPAGFVDQSGAAASGTMLSTPLCSGDISGYTFAYWNTNGIRQEDPSGRALHSFTFALDGPTTATAVFIRTGEDSDTDGLADWFENAHFGNLDKTGTDDPDNDGLTVQEEAIRGASPNIGDTIRDGGLASRRSTPLVFVAGTDVAYTLASTPAGLVAHNGVAPQGTTIVTPLLNGENSGYTFAYWNVNGVQQRDGYGRANPGATFTLAASTVATAVYVRTNDDADADGLPDWFELQQFGDLHHAPSEDPDRDGLTIEEEHARGLSPLAKDTYLVGGVAARRSAPLAFAASTGTRYELSSTPPGFVNETGVAPLGTTITTPALHGEIAGYAFTFWSVNGVRQADAAGQALPAASFQLAGPSLAQARFVSASEDADADGLPDWFEWSHFGSLAFGPDSDPDGDGLDVGAEWTRGLSPRLANVSSDGGVAARRSRTMAFIAAATVQPPVVSAPAPNVTILRGTATALEVNAVGDGPLAYQWFRGVSGVTANPIQGACSRSFFTGPLLASDSFWVQVGNWAGTTNGPTITVTTVTSPALVGPYAEWAASHFGSAWGDGTWETSIWGTGADPDHDAIVNLVEYALGLDPLTNSQEGVPTGHLIVDPVDGKTYLAIRYSMPTTVTGVAVTPEISSNLVEWAPGDIDSVLVTNTTANGTRTVTVRDRTPLGTASRRFIRLVVTMHE